MCRMWLPHKKLFIRSVPSSNAFDTIEIQAHSHSQQNLPLDHKQTICSLSSSKWCTRMTRSSSTRLIGAPLYS